jgi:hypothetical protein
MYVLNQKINNLEEKTSVLDNFSQSIFQFITQKEEAKLKQEEEKAQLQAPNVIQPQPQIVKEVVYSNNQPVTPLTPIVEEETETEDNHYNVNNNDSGEKMSENFESKEILSEKERIEYFNLKNIVKSPTK